MIDFDHSTSVEDDGMLIFSSIQSIVQNGPHLILDRIYDGIGFGCLGNEMLRDLVVSRVCCPGSKLATTNYLRRYRGKDVDINVIYRFMDKLDETYRQRVQQISVDHTRRILGGKIGLVFYDVTTLYFETAREDALRSPGFSKDGKTAESQVVLGLLVSMDGYPLSYSIFNGGQYEGRTMIPPNVVNSIGFIPFDIYMATHKILSRYAPIIRRKNHFNEVPIIFPREKILLSSGLFNMNFSIVCLVFHLWNLSYCFVWLNTHFMFSLVNASRQVSGCDLPSSSS